ncbi:hypothetical protein EVAR_22036_1 [Eumeta japonica]|uniref:Uncharacterized protein n=1 Tax=Eumeta variegata TaxID=151549 RepID=A0A4C1UUD6_EUMVA|nr:hypothetical protein EVAR_22036_1 [Eumeta japonica]
MGSVSKSSVGLGLDYIDSNIDNIKAKPSYHERGASIRQCWSSINHYGGPYKGLERRGKGSPGMAPIIRSRGHVPKTIVTFYGNTAQCNFTLKRPSRPSPPPCPAAEGPACG